MRKVLLIFVALHFIGFFAASWFFCGYSPVQTVTFFLAPHPRDLCKTGEPIAKALQEYHKRTGRYPASLGEGKIQAPSTFFGPWEYECINDGRSCKLSNGDYRRYLFVVYWSPGREWYVDS